MSDRTETTEVEHQEINRKDANDANKSPEEIRADIEATRAHISDELDEIKSRVNRDALKETVEHKLHDLQDSAVDGLKTLAVRTKDKAQERPVMATFIGVGLLAAGATVWYLMMGKEKNKRRVGSRRGYTVTPYFPATYGGSQAIDTRHVRAYPQSEDRTQVKERRPEMNERDRRDVDSDDMRYFHQHFETNYGNTGKSFAEYERAYRFGRKLADDDEFLDLPWDDVESEAKRRWNEEQQGSWESRYKAVRYGYERGRMHPTI